jgi:hypothetical protein
VLGCIASLHSVFVFSPSLTEPGTFRNPLQGFHEISRILNNKKNRSKCNFKNASRPIGGFASSFFIILFIYSTNNLNNNKHRSKCTQHKFKHKTTTPKTTPPQPQKNLNTKRKKKHHNTLLKILRIITPKNHILIDTITICRLTAGRAYANMKRSREDNSISEREIKKSRIPVVQLLANLENKVEVNSKVEVALVSFVGNTRVVY